MGTSKRIEGFIKYVRLQISNWNTRKTKIHRSSFPSVSAFNNSIQFNRGYWRSHFKQTPWSPHFETIDNGNLTCPVFNTVFSLRWISCGACRLHPPRWCYPMETSKNCTLWSIWNFNEFLSDRSVKNEYWNLVKNKKYKIIVRDGGAFYENVKVAFYLVLSFSWLESISSMKFISSRGRETIIFI